MTEKQNERRCIVAGALLPRASLLRFVIGPGGVVIPDISGKLPGKGIWVSCTQNAVKAAVQKKLFSKAAKMQVKAAETLPEEVAAHLRKAILNMLGVAKKSGVLVAGYTKVRALQEEKKAALILRACDSAFVAQEKQTATGNAQLVTLFSNDELSSTLGCENVVHAALKHSAVTDKCNMLIQRYVQYIR